MLLWRVFPFLETASDRSQPGHPLYVHPRQVRGRWDNPEYSLLNLAEEPAGAIGESFGNLTRWSPSMLTFPMLPGSERRLGVYRFDESVQPMCDLDDSPTLVRLGIRPTQVVVRDRRFTQALAARIHAEHRWAGIRWWSYQRPQWGLRVAWEHTSIEIERIEALSDHPALHEAADALAKRTENL